MGIALAANSSHSARKAWLYIMPYYSAKRRVLAGAIRPDEDDRLCAAARRQSWASLDRHAAHARRGSLAGRANKGARAQTIRLLTPV